MYLCVVLLIGVILESGHGLPIHGSSPPRESSVRIVFKKLSFEKLLGVKISSKASVGGHNGNIEIDAIGSKDGESVELLIINVGPEARIIPGRKAAKPKIHPIKHLKPHHVEPLKAMHLPSLPKPQNNLGTPMGVKIFAHDHGVVLGKSDAKQTGHLFTKPGSAGILQASKVPDGEAEGEGEEKKDSQPESVDTGDTDENAVQRGEAPAQSASSAASAVPAVAAIGGSPLAKTQETQRQITKLLGIKREKSVGGGSIAIGGGLAGRAVSKAETEHKKIASMLGIQLKKKEVRPSIPLAHSDLSGDHRKAVQLGTGIVAGGSAVRGGIPGSTAQRAQMNPEAKTPEGKTDDEKDEDIKLAEKEESEGGEKNEVDAVAPSTPPTVGDESQLRKIFGASLGKSAAAVVVLAKPGATREHASLVTQPLKHKAKDEQKNILHAIGIKTGKHENAVVHLRNKFKADLKNIKISKTELKPIVPKDTKILSTHLPKSIVQERTKIIGPKLPESIPHKDNKIIVAKLPITVRSNIPTPMTADKTSDSEESESGDTSDSTAQNDADDAT